ncbi:MAG: YlqD family protein [Candidatus Saganbacteria bacterium]|nr:YlqD family protein [Candidatus Saganbacteria bacterium]
MDENKLELKRVVMVKAIVTEGFKQNLVRELERAIGNIERQIEQIEQRAKEYLETLKKKGLNQKAAAFRHQMSEEKNKQMAAKIDLQRKIEEAKKLQLGSEFVQGPLEGPVDVAIGDNLYKKVGGAEVIVKDGIVQEIRGV